MSNVFSTQFVKAIQTHLAANAVDGACVTRTDLAKVVRKLAGKRTLDTAALNAFISASVNLGFFDSAEARCGTKRGVAGGITYEKIVARQPRKTAPKAKQTKTRIANDPSPALPVETPAQA